jgi:hypothetical protein
MVSYVSVKVSSPISAYRETATRSLSSPVNLRNSRLDGPTPLAIAIILVGAIGRQADQCCFRMGYDNQIGSQGCDGVDAGTKFRGPRLISMTLIVEQ